VIQRHIERAREIAGVATKVGLTLGIAAIYGITKVGQALRTPRQRAKDEEDLEKEIAKARRGKKADRGII